MSVLLGPCTRRASGLNFLRHTSRGYAAVPGGPRVKEETSDPRKDAIRRAMYPTNLRNRSTPTGGWRSDASLALQYAIPSAEAHDTIDRAYLLRRRHVRKAREAELARKFKCMNDAMEELAEVEPHLYYEANKHDDIRARTPAEEAIVPDLKLTEVKALEARIRGLFPREIRIPTDTPSRTGWNYKWSPFPRPL